MLRLSTGIKGLDDVLLGGLLAGRIYMAWGQPGAGKTTLGLQFLIEGAQRGESVLFVTLSESEAELRDNAKIHGWDLRGITFLDIHPMAEGSAEESQYSIFHPADVELIPVARRIQEELERLKPTRVVFDSLTQVRLLSRDPLRYRRQVLALKATLLSRGITSIFLGDNSRQELDSEIASIVQGVLCLTLKKGQEGMTRRAIEVEKYRGSAYREGEHPLRIDHGGIRVFPRLVSVAHGQTFERVAMPTGIAELDAMLGGGLDRGTCTLITGNSGAGKTSLGMAVIAQAVSRGERCVLYTFDEGPAEIIYRSTAIGVKVQQALDEGLLRIQKINPLLLYPDEFASWVRVEVEERQTRLVMIDSLNGYNQSMPDEKYLGRHMHQLIGYLNQMGVTTLLVNEVSVMTGEFAATEFGISYMADTVIVIRFYEYGGEIHKAIGTIKKRLSDHEKTLRKFSVTSAGVVVGNTLPNLRGILRGEAIWTQPVPDAEEGSDG